MSSCGTLGTLCSQRGLPDSLPHSTPSVSGSPGLSFLPGESGEVPSPSGRGGGHVNQGGHRRNLGLRPGVLKQAISSSESLGSLETRSRRLQAKRVRFKDEIFHGDHPVSPGLHSEGRLDDLHGYERCLLSYSDTQGIKTFPKVHLQQQGVPVSSSVFRSEYGPSGLYKSVSPSREDRPSSGFQSHPLPRRLAYHHKLQGGDVESEGICTEFDTTTRYSNQSGEVGSRPLPEDRVSRDDDRLESFLGFPYPETCQQRSLNFFRISVLKRTYSEVMAELTRAHVIIGKVCARRETENVTPSVSPSILLEQRVTEGHGSSSTISGARADLVDRQSKALSGCVLSKEGPRASGVFRRISGGVGGCSRNSSPVGQMVSSRPGTSHQLPRVESSLAGPSGGGVSGEGQDYFGLLGQHHGSCVYSETGRHQISVSVPACERPFSVVGGQPDYSAASLHQWGEERGGRYLESEGTDPPHGMDIELGGLRKTMAAVGTSSCGSVCHQPYQETTSVYVSSPGHSSSCNRRPVARLVQFGPLCLSSICNPAESHQQVQGQPQQQDYSNSAVVAAKKVVSGPCEVDSRGTQTPSSKSRSSDSTYGKVSAPKPPHASSNRMETLHRFLRHKGRSLKVSSAICESRGSNTNALYQQRWATFVSWCRARKLSASRPSINSICEFLLFLFEEKGLAVSTILGFKATLQSVHRHTGLNISTDQDVSEVVRSLKIRAPSKPKKMVHWNLDVLLRFLCSDKFEPLETSSLLNLTRKTLILVALALSKRISELHALARPVGFSSSGALLSLALDFRAKNDVKCKRLGRDFFIKDLTSLVGQEEEALLCPVRALKEYVRRTQDLVGSRMDRLFVSPRCPTRPSSKNALSCFIRTVIREAHSDLRPDLIPVLKVKSHELRAVSTSVAFAHNLSLQAVMEAAQWRCNSVFASHYLKDISYVYNDCRTLGPLLVAGSVVT